jgi:predicted nucleic acid-binding protein
MIADTTFLIHFLQEGAAGAGGRARAFLARHRAEFIRTSAISLGEVSVGFPNSGAASEYFKKWKVYPLHRGVIEAAADVDREMIRRGQRLGENDTWIAGFCRYYREPVISHDQAFNRVPGLRRIHY